MLMDRSIYVSLIRLRYVFNSVNDVVCVRGRIFDKNIASVFLLSPLVILKRNKKTKKITSTTKNLEHMTAKRERERERERRGGNSHPFPLLWIRPCCRVLL